MITYVDSKNVGKYTARFEQADAILKANSYEPKEDHDGKLIGTLEEYFSYLADLAAIDPIFLMLPVDEDTFNIDANTRKIAVPSVFAKNGVAVQGDELAEILFFTVDRFFDAMDLALEDVNIIIQWETADHMVGISKEYIRDINSRPGKVIFGWPLAKEIVSKPGEVTFSVRFYKLGTRQETNANGEPILTPTIIYSLNTLPAKVKVGQSLDYQLVGSAALDVLDCSDRIQQHIQNSDIPNPDGTPANPPEWILDVAEQDEIVDLDMLSYKFDDESQTVTKYLGHIMEAYAKGDGSISYVWYAQNLSVGAPGKPQVVGDKAVLDFDNVNMRYYTSAEIDGEETEGAMKTDRVYYTKVFNNDGSFTGLYKVYPYSEETVIKKRDDGTTYIEVEMKEVDIFECHTRAVAKAPGVYFCTASNRRYNARAYLDSHKITVPLPELPNILQATENEDIINDKYEEFVAGKDQVYHTHIIPFTVIKEDEDMVHVLLKDANGVSISMDAESPEKGNPKVSLTYEWYRGDSADILNPETQSIEAQYSISREDKDTTKKDIIAKPLEGEDVESFDKYYYVKVINHRNGATSSTYSKPFRVTDVPKKPKLISPTWNPNTNIKNITLGATITLTLDDSIPHDGDFKYQWYRAIVADDIDEFDDIVLRYEPADEGGDVTGGSYDEIITSATESSYIPDKAGYYYCRMINEYNGTQNYSYTPFFNVQSST